MGKRRFRRTLIASLLAVTVGVPAFVAAGPRLAAARRVVVVDPGRPGGPVRVVVTPARLRLYRGRIAVALRRRRIAFDASAARIATRLTIVENIAKEVDSLGGDVTAVEELIGKARSALDQAKATEAKAIAAFQAVPNASDKWEAFQDARDLGAQAVGELKQARDYGKQAVSELRSIIDKLEASEGGSQ